MTSTPAVGDRVRLTEGHNPSDTVGTVGELVSAEPSFYRPGDRYYAVKADDGRTVYGYAVELVTPPAEDFELVLDLARVQAVQVAREILGADPLASEVVELAAFILGEELLEDATELVGQPFVMAPQDEQPAPVGLVVSDDGAVVNWLGENYYRGEQPARPAVDTSEPLEIPSAEGYGGGVLRVVESVFAHSAAFVDFPKGESHAWLTSDDVDRVIAYLQALKG